jgi:hypothetical protein
MRGMCCVPQPRWLPALRAAKRGVLFALLTPQLTPLQAVAALVTSLYAEGGALCPINVLALRDGDSVEVRLYNWNALLPSLEKAFAIKLTPDEKTLLVGGGARRGGGIAAARAGSSFGQRARCRADALPR